MSRWQDGKWEEVSRNGHGVTTSCDAIVSYMFEDIDPDPFAYSFKVSQLEQRRGDPHVTPISESQAIAWGPFSFGGYDYYPVPQLSNKYLPAQHYLIERAIHREIPESGAMRVPVCALTFNRAHYTDCADRLKQLVEENEWGLLFTLPLE